MMSIYFAVSRRKTDPCPSIAHATEAALWSNESSHTVPQTPLYDSSRRPEWGSILPASRAPIAEQIQAAAYQKFK